MSLKVTPKKPPRKRPPQSATMVRVDDVDKDTAAASSVDETNNLSASVGEKSRDG